MSDGLQGKLQQVLRAIQDLQTKLAHLSKDEANARSELAAVHGWRTNGDPTRVRRQGAQLQRINQTLASIQDNRSSLELTLAKKQSERAQLDGDLQRASQQDRTRLELAQASRDAELRHELEAIRLAIPRNDSSVTGASVSALGDKEFDVFICHATEDKDDVVRPLAEALRTQGLRCWYDETELRVGDSIRRSIDLGLSRSRFGVVVLSHQFFAKHWPQVELDGLAAKEGSGAKVILPIWHMVSKDEVLAHSPTLADRVALNTSVETLNEIARKIADVVRQE